MKAHVTRLFLLSFVLVPSLVACGSSSSTSSDGIQSDVTQPSSPMQSALSAASDSMASSDAETGSTTAPDATLTSGSKMVAAAACVAVVTNPSPLDPNNLPSTYSIGWNYTNCVRSYRGGIIDGSRTVDITLATSADANRTAAMTFDLTRTYFNGADLASDGNSTLVSVGARSSGSVVRNVTGNGNRVFTGSAGNERFNHTYSVTLNLNDTYAAANSQQPNVFTLSQRITNGTTQLNHNLIDAVSMATFTNITFQPSVCAWPVAGTLEVVTTFKNGSTQDNTYTWGSACGSVTVNKSSTVVMTDAP